MQDIHINIHTLSTWLSPVAVANGQIWHTLNVHCVSEKTHQL